MLFSERIRTLRREQGLLQRELARAIGVDVPMYSRYEHGDRLPKRGQVVKLARLFHVDANQLVAMWLADVAMNAIGHDPMSARAAELLRERLDADYVAPVPEEMSPVVEPVAPPAEVSQPEPAVDPLIIKAAEVDDSRRTLLHQLGTMPLYLAGDARQMMGQIPDQSIDCIVTTPPYWSLRQYKTESISHATIEDFTDELLRVMAEAYRVLRPEGSLWLNLSDFYTDRSMMAFPWRVVIKMLDLQGWTLRNDVVWNKSQGHFETANDHLRNAHEFVFHLVKGANYYFDEEQARTGGHHLGEGGVMPVDVWSIAPERSSIERYRVSPERMVAFPILATCPRDGIVLDPFCGTGTTCKVAYDLNRRSIGIDINPDRIAFASGRIEQKPLSLF